VKLAILGAIAVAAGAALGVAGLVFSGGLWVVLGVLIWALFTRHEEGRRKRTEAADSADLGRARADERRPPYALGVALLLSIGLGSLAIGLLAIGFPAGERAWRWAPIAVGAIVTGFTLIAVPVRRSGTSLALAEEVGAPVAAARVRIEGKRQTGSEVNHQPRIEFDFLVEPDGMDPYRLKKKVTVPHTALGEIGIGERFEAKVDPRNRKRILIDWDSPLERVGGSS